MDAAGGRRDRKFLVQCSRFLAALKTRLGLILTKAAAMRVMINATVHTGCPAPVSDDDSDRASMKTHKNISQLIASRPPASRLRLLDCEVAPGRLHKEDGTNLSRCFLEGTDDRVISTSSPLPSGVGVVTPAFDKIPVQPMP